MLPRDELCKRTAIEIMEWYVDECDDEHCYFDVSGHYMTDVVLFNPLDRKHEYTSAQDKVLGDKYYINVINSPCRGLFISVRKSDEGHSKDIVNEHYGPGSDEWESRVRVLLLVNKLIKVQ